MSFAVNTGVDMGYTINRFVGTAINGILIAIFSCTGVLLVLKLNEALTKLVMLQNLDSLAPVPENFVIYFFMAIAYLIMSVFFGIRLIVICIFAGLCILVGLCLLIDATKGAAVSAWLYFIQMVFFQFIMVIYFSLAVLVIIALKPLMVVPQLESLLCLSMLLLAVFLAIKLIFGTSVIKWAGRAVISVVA